MTRLERHLRKSPDEKSLGPTIGGTPRNLNPFTAIDADKDLVVLEDIATVNFGEGVPDPTPGGATEAPSMAERRSRFYANNADFAVAAMSGPKRTISESNPADMKNPDGHFPRASGPMWKDVNHVALNVAPRSRRNATPASVNTYLHAEWTEPYWDAMRDETGIWNSPPPPEMEVERAIYDAMKRETIEVGGYGVPFPRYPKESDYYEYEAGGRGRTVTGLRPSRKFPFADTGPDASWTDGHPLYHATPTGFLPRIIADGLVGTPDRPLWLGASPSVWNEQWPDRRDAIRKAPANGMSFLRISPTEEINGRLSSLANLKRSNPDTPAGILAMDSNGNMIDARTSDSKRAAALFGEAIIFDDVKIPAENLEVLNQNGQWIPVYRADFSDVVFDPSGGADAGMAKDKNRGVRRVLGKLTNGKFGGEPEEETTSEQPVIRAPEDPRIAFEFPVPQSRIRYSDSYGGDDLIKNEQIAQRTEHERLAVSGSWDRIHSDHYDWWAYPIDRGSSAYGETFNVAGEPLERLKNDEEFISSLAKEIEIQALALGWSLYDGDFLPQLDWEKGQDWRKAYPTRLWKMTRSAQIFGLEKEFESLLSLQSSLEAAGVRFNHSEYWRNPGTIDDIPSLGETWKERQESRRFSASDTPFLERPPYSARQTSQQPTRVSEPNELRAFEDYDALPEETVFPILSDAEELADLLSEPDDAIEFGYPYEKIDKETRQMMADDIFFAISLLMDGIFPDEEAVDRRESAQQMRKFADDQEGLYPDDGDILYALADALDDPEILYEDLVYEAPKVSDVDAGMSANPTDPPKILKLTTDEEAQLDLFYAVPGVKASVVVRNTEGALVAPGKSAVMKPYLLAPHIDVNKMDPSDPVMQLLSPALKRAGLGSYPVDGHVVPKVQGPVVRDFADRLVGPMAVANAVSGTFPSADEMLTIYAINALIRARAEFLSDSTMTADQVNTAILNGVQVGRRLDGGDDMGGSLWKPGRNSARSSDLTTNTRPDGGDYEPRFSGTMDPFAYFTGRSDFLWSVINAMPESVKSKLAPYLTKPRSVSSWEDVSFFEDIEIRENDKTSRNLAPMVRSQAELAIRHAREHQKITKKWAQTAYDLMRESSLNDDEIAYVINEHWVKAAAFPLDSVRPGSVLGVAARLGVKAFSARYSPITKVDGRGEEEDYGLHEFFHHYLGQGFTRHGEYVAFRGPMDISDSYHGHLQWAWNVHGQLGMFVSKVMREAFGRQGDQGADEASAQRDESEALFNSISRAIYDRLKSMLASPDEKMAIFAQVFPELIDADSEDEAKIKELIRRQFAVRAGVDRFFNENIPVLRLMTAKDFLVPKEYWPYGGASKILQEETE